MVDKTSQGDYKWGLDVQRHFLQVGTRLNNERRRIQAGHIGTPKSKVG